MRYKDLLRKHKSGAGKGSPEKVHSPAPAETTGPLSQGAVAREETRASEEQVEDFFAGAAVVKESEKAGEIEKLYEKIEGFMHFGHGVLSIDEEAEKKSGTATLVKGGFNGRGVREECIAPADDETTCWDLNQAIGTKIFEECFECPKYQGSGNGIGKAGKQSRGEPGKAERKDAKAGGEALYEEFVADIKVLYQEAKAQKRIDLREAKRIAARLLEEIPGENRLLWLAINARKGSQLVSHVLNVAIFSIKVGVGLKCSPDDLLLLTTAAVLHDLGMTAIPEDIIEKKGKLTRQEYDLIKKHPHYSMEIIQNSAGEERSPEVERLIRIVGEEHERENGTGYPAGKRSEEIDDLAKIIGVVDVFEALSHDRGHRSEYSSFQAIQVIIQMRNEFFSPQVVKAVITQISIFPLESYVKLNNGETGKVIKTNFTHPMRPVVEIISDSKGEKLKEKREVDLSKNPLIFITRPVGEEEL
jgi:HD-GYP domain-containing protein (c-di-GMP phosphodiesterase class II)